MLQKENYGELTREISRRKNQIVGTNFNKNKLYQNLLPSFTNKIIPNELIWN